MAKRITALAAGLGGALVVLTATAAPSAAVTLLRGGFAETVNVSSGAPALLRGARPLPQRAAAATPRRAAAWRAPLQFRAGHGTLWIVDPDTGRIQICQLRGTGRVERKFNVVCSGG